MINIIINNYNYGVFLRETIDSASQKNYYSFVTEDLC